MPVADVSMKEEQSRRFKWARHRLNMTQREIAKEVGLTHARYAQVESGYAFSKVESCEKFAEALGVTVAWLMLAAPARANLNAIPREVRTWIMSLPQVDQEYILTMLAAIE